MPSSARPLIGRRGGPGGEHSLMRHPAVTIVSSPRTAPSPQDRSDSSTVRDGCTGCVSVCVRVCVCSRFGRAPQGTSCGWTICRATTLAGLVMLSVYGTVWAFTLWSVTSETKLPETTNQTHATNTTHESQTKQHRDRINRTNGEAAARQTPRGEGRHKSNGDRRGPLV